MPMRALLLATAAFALLTLVGCASPETFSVSVQNATDEPLTVGFVKGGGAPAPGWESPEDYAMLPPSRQPNTWGRVIEPGMTGSAHISGTFEHGSAPYLRIYAGAHTANDLLAISRGNNRLDLMLDPGLPNHFLVQIHDGRLAAHVAPMHHEPP
jgi:hypothetical protein